MLPSSSERKRKYCPHESMPCVVFAMNSEAVIVEMQSAPAPSGARKMGTFIGMNDERKQNETMLEKPSNTYSLGLKKSKNAAVDKRLRQEDKKGEEEEDVEKK